MPKAPKASALNSYQPRCHSHKGHVSNWLAQLIKAPIASNPNLMNLLDNLANNCQSHNLIDSDSFSIEDRMRIDKPLFLRYVEGRSIMFELDVCRK